MYFSIKKVNVYVIFKLNGLKFLKFIFVIYDYLFFFMLKLKIYVLLGL